MTRKKIHKGTSGLFRFLFLLLALWPQALSAEGRLTKERLLGEDNDAPWEISARKLSYKGEEALYVAEGDVVIRRNDQVLYAQKATYQTETGIAEVSGDVRFESGGDILTGERGVFNLKKNTGRIEKGTLFLKESHYYFSSDVAEKIDEDTYIIKNCLLTTCGGTNPFWTITASHVRVKVEGYGRARDAAFRIYDVPLLYVPYLIFPAKTERQTGFLPPRVGYSSRLGLDFELPFFWAISDQVDATFYQRGMSKRGYMQGLEFRYVADADSKGMLLFDILSDSHDKDMNDPDDVELSPFDRTNDTRYWFRGRADQDLPFGITARVDADYVSDQDYLVEFGRGVEGSQGRPDLQTGFGRPFEENRSPTRRSALRLSRDGESYSLQALSSYHQRPEDPPQDTTPQPLGGALYSLLPTRFRDLPLYYSLDADYDYVWRDFGTKGHRFSMAPEVRLPLWPSKYFEFEPFVRYHHVSQWHEEEDGDRDHHHRQAYEMGARVMTNLERVYTVNVWGGKRLKHRIWPTLSYRYRVPQDPDAFMPWYEPIDVEGKVNVVAFSLQNFLDARQENEKGAVRYRQWVTLDLVQAYDIDEARRDEKPGRDNEPFAPFFAEMIVRPYDEVDIRGSAQWDHYDEEVETADFSLELSVAREGGRRDIYTLDYLYENGGREFLNFWIDVYLANGLSVGGALRRNLRFSESISSSYWLEYREHCAGVRFAAHTGEDETSFLVTFQLRGLGDDRDW